MPLVRPLLAAAAAVALAGCAGQQSPGPVVDAQPAPSTSAAAPAAAPSPSPSATPSPSPSPTAPAAQEVRLTVAGGRVTGDTGRVKVPVGERVRLTVTTDAPDEVHVHGYDLTLPLAAGRPGTLEFVADAPGIYTIELHDTHTELARLQVQ